MKKLRILILLLLGSVSTYSLFENFKSEQRTRILKVDLMELSKAKYGLFNVDEWKAIITEIVQKKIDDFNLTDENKEALRQKIDLFLNQAINNHERKFKEEESSSIRGLFKIGVANLLDVYDRMEDDIPRMTESIISMLEDPETKKKLKIYSEGLIEEYAGSTFSEIDYSRLSAILIKYQASDKKEGILKLNELIRETKKSGEIYKWIMYASFVLLFVYFQFNKGIGKVDISVGLALCLFLLVTGLLLPMIDIDARVKEFNFTVLGEPVSFQDQVIYFKSKSILEVVSLMMSQGKADILIVGFLVLTFSVLFPLTKLITSFLFLFSKKIKSNKIVQFFVFKSGKWSMADVMVVAIFMSYIGFSSILTEQLRQLDKVSKNLEVLTTNESILNAGFFLFTSFVVLGMIVSSRISKIE